MHRALLARLQALVEIDEAANIMSCIKDKENVENLKEHFASYLTSHMSTWKCHMPHKFEDLTLWKFIMEQRNSIYTLVEKRMLKIIRVASNERESELRGLKFRSYED